MLDVNTKEFLKYLDSLIREHDAKTHKFYDESVMHMRDMGVHLTGDSPAKLLNIKRPNEDEEAKQYRMDSYKPKTKASANKAVSIINRIYNERLFSIEYRPSDVELIDSDFSLKRYLTEDYPYYTSLVNYMKSVFTKTHLKDPNGALAIMPKDFDIEDNTVFDPVPTFFNSEQLVDFKDDEFYVIIEKGGDLDPVKAIVFDEVAIYVFKKKTRGDNFSLKFTYEHGFGVPPIFRVQGIVDKSEKPVLYESHIAGVLPHWDEAVGMFSDLQAAIVNHLYPDKWEYTIDCDNKMCHDGQIEVTDAGDKKRWVQCPRCTGTGKVTTKGPYNIYQIKREALNPDAPLPTPPFGYGEKELGSTELLEQLAEKEIQKGFEAINMDIVNKSGENQSGVAKVIDRQDLDSFLDVYSSHIFNYILPNIIWFTILWRYSEILGDSKEEVEEKIQEFFPVIKEPTTFDIFSIQLLTEEFSKLKESGVNASFLTAIEKEIIEKRFTNEHTKAFYTTMIDVNPLNSFTDDQIMTLGRVLEREDLYIHAKAKDLIEQAIAEDEDFLDKSLEEKKEKIQALAKSKLMPIVADPENPLNE